MIVIRTAEEIELLRKSNILVSKALALIAENIRPGVTTQKLDKLAEEYIRDNNAVPGFLGYNGYPKTLCTSVNEQVVHGIPSGQVLTDGDIISIDCGVILDGYYGDSAYTFQVGEVSQDIRDLLTATKESLINAVRMAVEGNRVGDIGFTVQQYCEERGYSVVRELVGHGLGKKLHEAPEIPNYGKRGRGAKLKAGMVLCIEPMINLGKKDVVQEPDGWTIRTRDKQPSAHYELAVAVGKNEVDILSTFRYIEQIINIEK